MAVPVWPIDTLRPIEETWRRQRVTIDGGVAYDGTPHPILADGGGAWRADLKFGLLGQADLKLYAALLELMDGGAAPIVMPRRDIRLRGAAGQRPAGALAVNAALRATTLSFTQASAVPLVGGEPFSVAHSTIGRRLYVVRTVTSQAGAAAVITIRPPLREALTAGAALDFADPGCVMRLLDPDRAAAAVRLRRRADVQLALGEAFGAGVV